MGVLQVRWPMNHGTAYRHHALAVVEEQTAPDDDSNENEPNFRVTELVFVNVVASMVATGGHLDRFCPMFTDACARARVSFLCCTVLQHTIQCARLKMNGAALEHRLAETVQDRDQLQEVVAQFEQVWVINILFFAHFCRKITCCFHFSASMSLLPFLCFRFSGSLCCGIVEAGASGGGVGQAAQAVGTFYPGF
jgi:hypothetical protein